MISLQSQYVMKGLGKNISLSVHKIQLVLFDSTALTTENNHSTYYFPPLS